MSCIIELRNNKVGGWRRYGPSVYDKDEADDMVKCLETAVMELNDKDRFPSLWVDRHGPIYYEFRIRPFSESSTVLKIEYDDIYHKVVL
jgi:hypothetical protein